ncbi:hypothetical protein IWZ00DRAFT_168942 [Phyllosticta capitalensis]
MRAVPSIALLSHGLIACQMYNGDLQYEAKSLDQPGKGLSTDPHVTFPVNQQPHFAGTRCTPGSALQVVALHGPCRSCSWDVRPQTSLLIWISGQHGSAPTIYSAMATWLLSCLSTAGLILAVLDLPHHQKREAV